MLKKIVFIVISTLLLANPNIAKSDENILLYKDKVSLYESLISNVNITFFEFNDYLEGSTPPSDSITINGKRLEQFTGNINDLIFYSDSGVSKSLKSFTKDKLDSNLSSDELIAKLSGIPLHQKGYEKFLKEYPPTVVNLGIKYINPDVIKWVTNNLYIPPDTMIFGFKSQEIYNKAFKTFFRRNAESYLYLHKSKSFALSAKEAYLSNVREELKEKSTINNFDILLKTYSIKLSSSKSDNENAIAIGFWLRRSIDQTDKVLWLGLTKIMKNYDGQWFGNIKNKNSL